MINFKSPEIVKAREKYLESMDVLDINDVQPTNPSIAGTAGTSETKDSESTVPGVSLSLNSSFHMNAPSTPSIQTEPLIDRRSNRGAQGRRTFHASISKIAPDQKMDQMDASEDIDFLRIWIQREKQSRDTEEVRTVCRKLQTACMLREVMLFVMSTFNCITSRDYMLFPNSLHRTNVPFPTAMGLYG